MQAPVEPLFKWSKVVWEYLGFLAAFGTFGALGFEFLVMAPIRRRVGGVPLDGSSWAAPVRSNSARIGAAGAVLGLLGVFLEAAATGAEKQIGFIGGLSTEGLAVPMHIVALLIILASFIAASRDVRRAWWLAAIVALVLQFRNLFTLRWATLINPIHEFAASLWIGTLFVILAAALPIVMRGATPPQDRGRVVRELVNSFSTSALWLGGVLVLSGITTAWRHLKYVEALWTTPYGQTFLGKLCLVVLVFAVAAVNWRRVRPALNTEASVGTFRRSGWSEVTLAALVLVVTAFLVSLPTPKGH